MVLGRDVGHERQALAPRDPHQEVVGVGHVILDLQALGVGEQRLADAGRQEGLAPVNLWEGFRSLAVVLAAEAALTGRSVPTPSPRRKLQS